MKLLLDSHLLIWLLYEPERVPEHVVSEIGTASAVVLSVASLWELALKHAAGKLAYSPAELAEGRAALNLEELPVLGEHVTALSEVKLPHADPFDRILVAQAQVEQSVLVTADANLLGSGYATLRAR